MTFDVSARAYDEFMGTWSQRLAPHMIEFAGLERGLRALDVGCGPGALTVALVDALGADAVAGVDPSTSFVAATRERAPGVDVRQARAEELPFPDGAFDAALAQLVVHFMADPLAGLAEMQRVTRVGGVCAASVWDYAPGRGPLGPFWEAARDLNPNVVDELELPGVRRGHLGELFATAGFADVAEATLSAERAYDSFDDWWAPFTRGVGPGGAHVAELDAEQRQALREHCRSMLPAVPFVLTAHAWAVRGTVPRAGSSKRGR